ncbi:MAG: PRC-barrel domain-containing protein [Bacteroidia bacterium]|nr:PRC-barrel domain-containing protein [Bacteroidia bacterium]
MKRSIKSLIGFTIGATDGEIGKVKEFYFDDETWTIRYLIVETGSWLFGRKVLISPMALLTPDWKKNIFPINLSMEQIKNSPAIDTEKPVSRQQELELYAYYPWGSYWGSGFYAGGMRPPVSMYNVLLKEDDNEVIKEPQGDQHLRSSDQVTGYNIKASDGEIGNVEDFLIDDSNWKIDFLVIDAGNWFHGKTVLISPKWIKEIKWETSEVIVNVSRERVKNSPSYDIGQPLNEAYETKLYNHYDGLISHLM